MTPDPAGLSAANAGAPQSLNRFSYVGHNPVNSYDPLGLWCSADVGGHDTPCNPGNFNGGTGDVTAGWFSMDITDYGVWFSGYPGAGLGGYPEIGGTGCFLPGECSGLPSGIVIPPLTLGDLLGLPDPNAQCDFGPCNGLVPLQLPTIPKSGTCPVDANGNRDPLCLEGVDPNRHGLAPSCRSLQNQYRRVIEKMVMSCKIPGSKQCDRSEAIFQSVDGRYVDPDHPEMGSYRVLVADYPQGNPARTLCQVIPILR